MAVWSPVVRSSPASLSIKTSPSPAIAVWSPVLISSVAFRLKTPIVPSDLISTL